jgi:hypothetical protein
MKAISDSAHWSAPVHEAARAEYELLPPAFFDACTEFDQFLMGDDSTGYKLEEDLHPLVYRCTSANP